MDKAGLFVFGGITACTTGLGAWQTQRYLEAKNAVATATTSPLPSDTLATSEFDALKLVQVGPRLPPAAQGQSGDGVARRTGHIVYGVHARDPRTIVSLGWTASSTPIESARRALRDRPALPVRRLPAGEGGEEGNMFSPVNPAGTKKLLWGKKEDLLRELSETSEARFALASEAISSDFVPVSAPGATWLSPEKHLGYALTWYTLSLAGMFMTFRLVRVSQAARRVPATLAKKSA